MTYPEHSRRDRLAMRPGDRYAAPAGGEPVVGLHDRRAPSAGVLVAACLWALGSAVAGAGVGVAALVAVAGDPPPWYPPSVLATGAVGLAGTIGGLRLAGIARLRWKLLAAGTAAVIVAALLTVAVVAG